MKETKLSLKVNGQYKNLDLRQMDPDTFIVVEKVFAEGYKKESIKFKNKDGSPSVYFNCKVRYGDDETTFFLNENAHKKYASIGGIGDKVKIECTLVKGYKGVFRQNFNFVKA